MITLDEFRRITAHLDGNVRISTAGGDPDVVIDYGDVIMLDPNRGGDRSSGRDKPLPPKQLSDGVILWKDLTLDPRG